MRELKFRAWNGNKMLYDIAPVNSTVLIDLKTSELAKINGDFQYMQYSGITDKNGKTIYESDVVVCYRWGNEFGRGVVRYGRFDSSHEAGYSQHNHIGFYVEEKPGHQLWNSVEEDIEWEGVEVIGNIHENPEIVAQHPSKSTD